MCSSRHYVELTSSRHKEAQTSSYEPPTKKLRYSNQASVTIFAGAIEQPFSVSEDLICEKSLFFASACSEKWEEGQTKIVRLPCVKPEVLDSYIHWVYTRELQVPAKPPTGEYLPFGEAEALNNVSHQQHVALYLAAQFFLDDELQDRVLESLRRWLFDSDATPIEPELVALVWKESARSSTLQELVLDAVSTTHSEDTYDLGFVKACGQDFHDDLTQELLLRIRQGHHK
jgi:hypothetical protein